MDVSMGINPDHTKVWEMPGMSTNGTNRQAAKNKYSWPPNIMGLNCVGLLIHKFFSMSTYNY